MRMWLRTLLQMGEAEAVVWDYVNDISLFIASYGQFQQQDSGTFTYASDFYIAAYVAVDSAGYGLAQSYAELFW